MTLSEILTVVMLHADD